MEHFAASHQYRKPAVASSDGVAVAQSRDVAAIGARILARGGNAVDAAVSMSLALGVIEPWMSGLGGGGFAILRDGGTGALLCVDFGMISPRKLDLDDYKLTKAKSAGGLFGWPGVVEDRNMKGPYSIAVPGLVAGLALAHRSYGALPWPTVVAPAVDLAEEGLPIDWYSALSILVEARELAEYDAARELYLAGGMPPRPLSDGSLPRIKLESLAQTLKLLAEPSGPANFYHGELSRLLVADLEAAGCKISTRDLDSYKAQFVRPLEIHYRDAQIFVPAGLTAGPTLASVLGRWSKAFAPLAGQNEPNAKHYRIYARELNKAYRERLSKMGAGDSQKSPSSTSHFCVIDRRGNAVSWTQTLLSRFGSKIISPSTGILMNNGIMWFDPRPGKPNSIAPGKVPLSNMCPAVALSPRLGMLALGASGGRKIMPAVAQVLSFMIDFGQDIDAAIHQPRIDSSAAGVTLVDRRLGDPILSEVAKSVDAEMVDLMPYPAHFANPSAAQLDSGRRRFAVADPASPWSGAVAVEDVSIMEI